MAELSEPLAAPMAEPLKTSVSRKILTWPGNLKLGTKFAILLAVAAPLSGIVTYALLANIEPVGLDPRLGDALIWLNVAMLAALAGLIATRVAKLIIQRRSGSAGSQLHIRLVTLFSLIAVAPAILVAIFSTVSVDLGLEAWFSERVKNSINNSVAVAEAYVDEHRRVIQADVLAMANDLNRAAATYRSKPQRFSQLLSSQAAYRALPEAYVIDSSGEILARGLLSLGYGFDPPPADALEAAIGGQSVIMTNKEGYRVRAIVRLPSFVDGYLYVGRYLDPAVLATLRKSRENQTQYLQLEGKRSGVKITFALMYLLFTLLVLFAAIWVGLWFANKLARPIGDLITAAEQVTAGNLAVRVRDIDNRDEIGGLGQAFNRMTGQLQAQRNELIHTNHKLDDRRHFMEAVLSGVSAGVIGLEGSGRIEVVNRRALDLLNLKEESFVGSILDESVPELESMMAALRNGDLTPTIEGRHIHVLVGDDNRELFVRITAEWSGTVITGFVVTLDDLTQLARAERMAAWGDVARRIAHEIKNPLTPIQLSAERLKRRFSKDAGEGRAVFEQCTDTIVRQVGDIRRMVDEFSAFARMPQPTFNAENLTEIARQAVFLQQVGHPDITYGVIAPDEPLMAECDGRLISQALVNLLKNAAEGIAACRTRDEGTRIEGRIRIEIEPRDDMFVISVTDNGCGLPEHLKDRLLEPYVTTREKGTGLGLAIVKKIMDEHGGALDLNNREDELGVRAQLHIPKLRNKGNRSPKHDKKEVLLTS